MKKLFLSVLTILSVCVLAVSATDTDTSTTNSATKSTTKPNFEKMGPPPHDSNSVNRPAPPKGNFNGGKRPRKRPDAKPGGDKIPPELMQNSNTTTDTSTSN